MSDDQTFRDRVEAGRVLAGDLWKYRGRRDALVLALPRGGVPVGYEVALALGLPLDVFLVRKLGAPGFTELAMGAIASGGVTVLNSEVIRSLDVPPAEVREAAARERAELRRRERLYRRGRPMIEVAGKSVLLVDDGLATGSTMRAAVAAVRRLGPERVVVAVPVAAPASCEEMKAVADECVCAVRPQPFRAVGLWFHDFSQTTDEEVCDLLDRARGREPVTAPA